MFAIFVERRRADTMELSACKGRFEQVRSVHCAVRFACADQGMYLVNKENDLAVGFFNFLQDGFQPFFKFSAIFRPRNERAHIEREQFFIPHRFRHIARDNADRKPFGNSGFPDAWFTDEDGIIF